jgi:hypothetical protein
MPSLGFLGNAINRCEAFADEALLGKPCQFVSEALPSRMGAIHKQRLNKPRKESTSPPPPRTRCQDGGLAVITNDFAAANLRIA